MPRNGSKQGCLDLRCLKNKKTTCVYVRVCQIHIIIKVMKNKVSIVQLETIQCPIAIFPLSLPLPCHSCPDAPFPQPVLSFAISRHNGKQQKNNPITGGKRQWIWEIPNDKVTWQGLEILYPMILVGFPGLPSSPFSRQTRYHSVEESILQQLQMMSSGVVS